MKNVALVLAAASACLTHALATETPRGTLLELHSCELYAGACVINSESTCGGRYMLQAWNFTGGEYDGTSLAGLQVAALHSASQNLAAENASSDQVMVYLPQTATEKQREALVAWFKSVSKVTHIQTRTAPLCFASTAEGYRFSVGDRISVTAMDPARCPLAGCGEELWYSPRVHTTVFTIAIARASHVTEPSLKLKWEDAGRRSIFLAKFGEASPTRDAFVTLADLCGSAEKLF